MLNEYVYCPRLFYYEFVEDIFVESADTTRGSQAHARVDQGAGALPPPKRDGERDDEPETIHSRSVELASDRLGVICKMDLVESRAGQDLFSSPTVSPVEYKVGSPREGENGIDLWDTDKIQLTLQCLILRDNGYDCWEGTLYYRATRQRVRLEITPELEAWALETIAAARSCATGSMPRPLVSSPKCTRCSLAPVCLPDETRYLEKLAPSEDLSVDKPARFFGRRLLAPRDERRALYLNTPGFSVGRKGEVLEIRDKKEVIQEVRIRDVCHLGLFGNIQVSTQAVQELCALEVPITYFSGGGWFYGVTQALGLKNVFTRVAQFRAAENAAFTLKLARQFVAGKIRNHRTLLMRNHIEPPEVDIRRLREASGDALRAPRLEALLGVEGAAAAVYFAAFSGMLKQTNGGEPESVFAFNFQDRNRRPPRDPVNALLSLGYSLLAKDCTIAAQVVGFDPYVGYLHRPRFGRPALALDIMEEFRPLIADSVVLTLVNNRMLDSRHFVAAGRSINLTPAGRKIFFEVYETRMNTVVTHPLFDYKVCYRRAIELQFRLLARMLVGELEHYHPFVTR
jgi:CRISPR-associated protein Cas1